MVTDNHISWLNQSYDVHMYNYNIILNHIIKSKWFTWYIILIIEIHLKIVVNLLFCWDFYWFQRISSQLLFSNSFFSFSLFLSFYRFLSFNFSVKWINYASSSQFSTYLYMHRFKQAEEAYKRSMHVTLTKQTGGCFQFNEPLVA